MIKVWKHNYFMTKNCFLCHKAYYYKTIGFSNPGSLGIAFKGWKASSHNWKRSSLFAWSIWFDQEIYRQDKSTVFGYANGKRLCSGFRSKLCWTSKVSNTLCSNMIRVPASHQYFYWYIVESWNRQHHGQTIHLSEKFNSINLFKILCVVTWAQLFLTSMVMEAVRGL